jgi:hypothetical protein
MSTAHHDDDAARAHDAGSHDFDGEPARALPADEPPTPVWVPALGLALFVMTGVVFLASGASEAPAAERADAEQSRKAQPQTPQLAQEPATPPTPTARPAPEEAAVPGSGAGTPPGTVRKISPQELDELKKRIQEARPQGAPPYRPAPAPNK